MFYLLLFNLCWCITVISCPHIEKQSLLSFKHSLLDPYHSLSSWDEHVNCCKWKGVSCSSNLSGQVHQLRLQEYSLGGEISPSLLNLKHLKHLDLSQNNFDEIAIPFFIGSLTSLEYLNLSSAGFLGMIPHHNIGNLSNLHTLDLKWASFWGGVDSLEWLSRLSKLERLSMNCLNLSESSNWQQVINKLPSLVQLRLRECILNNTDSAPLNDATNNISRSNLAILDIGYHDEDHDYSPSPTRNLHLIIPTWIFQLRNLIYLDLNGHAYEGQIPSVSNTTKLRYIDLSNNYFNSRIPEWLFFSKDLKFLNLAWNSDIFGDISSNLGNLSSLQELYLGQNKLFGNLPETLGQLSNLVSLDVAYNMLEGVVTETHFARLSRLESFYAQGNNLTLEIRPNWIPPFKIIFLQLMSWNLGSRIPPWLDTQKMSIEYLDLSNTGLKDNVPNWFWSIRSLNLSFNQLYGNIPVISSPAQFVFLRSNRLSGQVPRLSASLSGLDLSNNLFSGDISHSICSTTNSPELLMNLHLGGNHLSGELPDCFMNFPHLRMLNLNNNSMFGRIPNSIGFLADLESLNLRGNNFSGDIPFSMGNCTQLVLIDLADNSLSGNLPKWNLYSLSRLVILILRSNKLSGEIPSAICQVSYLQILDLSNNMFSGTIPRCVNNFTTMTTKTRSDTLQSSVIDEGFPETATIVKKGKELTYDYTLSLVTSIDISQNNLSGNIPVEITSLVALGSLNLSRNHLTGPIPLAIGNMTQLESLDFSNNSLSGELPISFTDISSLSYLNVSYNHLTGRIPESTQLCSLNESSFIGNHLRGPPLTSSCSSTSNDVKAPGTRPSKEGKADEPEIEWLYVFISLGWAVGLSAFLTTLCLKKSWRGAYFEFIEDMWDTTYVHVHVKWRKLKNAVGLSM